MNDLHFSKLKEALIKRDIEIWNDFVSTLNIQIDLSGADLSEENLKYINLKGVNLSGANLSGANLSFVNLNDVDLRTVDLRNTDLSNAYLNGADLSGADLSRANTYGISTSTFKGSKHFAVQIGEFISIGCYTLKITKWLKLADKIAKIENYTNEEKNEYLKYINECKEKM